MPTSLVVLAALAVLVPVRGPAQAIRLPAVIPSPTITALQREVALARRTTPIIEPYTPDSSFVLVTFVYRDTLHARTIQVSGGNWRGTLSNALEHFFPPTR